MLPAKGTRRKNERAKKVYCRG